jgi:hypothetical protein
MATKVFTGVDIDFTVVITGETGTDWDNVVEPAWNATNDINGSSGAVSDGNVSGHLLAGFCGLHDDGSSIPPNIEVTGLQIEFDYVVSSASPTTIGGGDTPHDIALPAGGSGHYNQSPPVLDYLPSTDRAGLFTNPSFLWDFIATGTTNPRSITIANFKVTVTYTNLDTAFSITSVAPSSGPMAGGTPVTITGVGFPADVIVSFDSFYAALDVVRVSSTSITCVAPAHPAGLVGVTVTGVDDTATKANAFTYAGVFPNPFELDGIRRDPQITIRDVLNDAPNELTFKKDGDEIEVGTPLVVRDTDASRLFVGIALRVDQEYEGLTDQLVYNVQATDNMWYLNRRLPVGKWEDVSATTVIRELIQKFAPSFTTVHVEAGLPDISVTFTRDQNVGQCLTQIVGLVGGHWYPDLDNDIHAFTEETSDAPDELNNTTNVTLMRDPPLKKSTDLSQIRTRVYVRGAGSADGTAFEAPVSPPSTEIAVLTPTTGGSISYDTSGQFQVFYKFSFVTANGEAIDNGSGKGFSMNSLSDPTATAVDIANIEQSIDVRVTSINMYRTPNNDQEHFYLIGSVPNDPAEALVNIPQSFIDGMSDSDLVLQDPAPDVNTTASIYCMREDIPAQVALAAIEGGDGIHEYQVSDPSITTLEQAQAVGDAELALFKNPIVSITYGTRDRKTRSGKTVTANLTDPPCVGEFKIQEVTVTQIDETSGGTFNPLFTVSASSIRFTLEDLLRNVLLKGDGAGGGGGGSGSGGGSSTAGGGASGRAVAADRLTTPRNINSVAFDGTANINITAAPDHLGETPTGTVNGSNTVFTTSAAYKTGSLTVYINGLRQKKTTHWTETTSTTFTMNQAPATGDLVTVDYETN